MTADLSGIISMFLGDSDLGGGGKGLLRSFVSVEEVGETAFMEYFCGKVELIGDDDKLSNDTVCGTFGLTSLPWREGGTEGRFRPTLGDG